MGAGGRCPWFGVSTPPVPHYISSVYSSGHGCDRRHMNVYFFIFPVMSSVMRFIIKYILQRISLWSPFFVAVMSQTVTKLGARPGERVWGEQVCREKSSLLVWQVLKSNPCVQIYSCTIFISFHSNCVHIRYYMWSSGQKWVSPSYKHYCTFCLWICFKKIWILCC